MKIIGIGHYSRTGKDTLANYIVEHLLDKGVNAQKRSLATPLKAVTHYLFRWAGLREEAFYDRPQTEHMREEPLPELGITPVELWVKLGLQVRDIHPDTFVKATLREDCDVLVVPDVRFPNEVEAIREAGGTLIKLTRPGISPRNTPADQALVDYTGWDLTLDARYLDELRVFARNIGHDLLWD